MEFCKEIDDGASVSKEEDIFAVKKKNTYDDKIGIADLVDSKDKRPNSEEDAASKHKNHQEDDKLPNQPAKHEEEITSKPEETENETNTLPQLTAMEVKVVQGTSDVVLVNGLLRVGDRIVVAGLQGPVVTSISALLTPHPVKKLRFKGLEHAIVGASLYVVRRNDDIEVIKKSAMAYVNSVMSRIKKNGEGVYVQASTLASVEALLDFSKAREVNIPVGGMSIGPVHKKDVMRASATLEKKRECAAILALGVEVTPEASQLAHQLGVKIFTCDDIRGLLLQFKSHLDYMDKILVPVFPCVLKIMPTVIMRTKYPIVLDVYVVEGIAKIGKPICVPGREFVEIGRIVYIQDDEHRVVDYAMKGQRVTINILGSNPEELQKMFGRDFEMKDELVSKITPDSVYALRKQYMGDLSTEDNTLLFKMKQLFKI
ncbi:hypothetical protein SASPL_116469 [Salvia splendens]|uniref:Translation initiation factor 5B n=1 Tax=Salvia splendens TaxID=180675 RepID=A0A8X8XT10_SALSN|nr:hypothetical protein SASPL_116469 [Salvia splendens]